MAFDLFADAREQALRQLEARQGYGAARRAPQKKASDPITRTQLTVGAAVAVLLFHFNFKPLPSALVALAGGVILGQLDGLRSRPRVRLLQQDPDSPYIPSTPSRPDGYLSGPLYDASEYFGGVEDWVSDNPF